MSIKYDIFIINMNVLGKIVKGKIVLFNFFRSLSQSKTPKPITEREKLEKQYLDNIKW